MLNHILKYKKGKYTLIANGEQITGFSYLDVLTQLVRKPIPIKYAKFTKRQKFDWVENNIKGK